MRPKMKAVMKRQAGPGAEIVTVDVPEIGPRDVLIKVEATTICGTDMHIYNWDAWAQSRVTTPRIMGHELAGTVTEIGAEVAEVKVGDFVSVETHIVCGHCAQCRTGQSHICQNVEIIGVDRDGCFAEYVAMPAGNVWKNARRIDPAVAAMQEPFGNAVHTALAGPLAGRSVAVTGCGPIGIFALGIVEASGATSIYGTDVNDFKLELTRRVAKRTRLINTTHEDPVETILRETDGAGVDVVLEMSGHPVAIQQALKIAKNGGRVSLLGLPAKPVQIDLSKDVIFKGLTIQGISGRRMFETWYQTAGFVIDGLVDIAPLITHRFRLDEFDQAMETMLAGKCGKVALLP